MSEEQTRTLIVDTLEVAVPLWISQLREVPWKLIDARREPCMLMIAEHGDDILFKSKRQGDTAKAFNALAEAVAILSFIPGGVKVFGRIWTHQHPDVTYPVTGSE